MSTQNEETHLSRALNRRRRNSKLKRVAAVLVVSLALVGLIDLLTNPGDHTTSVAPSPFAHRLP